MTKIKLKNTINLYKNQGLPGPGAGPGGAMAPAFFFRPGHGGAKAPEKFFGPGPGGAKAPEKYFGPGPGGAMVPAILRPLVIIKIYYRKANITS